MKIDWESHWQTPGSGLLKNLLEKILDKTGFSLFACRKSKKIGEKLLRDRTFPTIIEVGSGTGQLARGLGQTFVPAKIFLIDIAFSALKKVNTTSAHLINADIHMVPLADGCCDLSCSVGTIEHFPDPIPIIKEMKRISSAYVLCAVPAPSVIWNTATLIRELVEKDASLWAENTRYYSRAQLVGIFAAAGIHNIRTDQQTFLGLPFINIVYGTCQAD